MTDQQVVNLTFGMEHLTNAVSNLQETVSRQCELIEAQNERMRALEIALDNVVQMQKINS